MDYSNLSSCLTYRYAHPFAQESSPWVSLETVKLTVSKMDLTIFPCLILFFTSLNDLILHPVAEGRILEITLDSFLFSTSRFNWWPNLVDFIVQICYCHKKWFTLLFYISPLHHCPLTDRPLYLLSSLGERRSHIIWCRHLVKEFLCSQVFNSLSTG